MIIRRPPDIRASEITPKSVYLRRREFLGGAPALAVAAALPFGPASAALTAAKSPFSTDGMASIDGTDYRFSVHRAELADGFISLAIRV